MYQISPMNWILVFFLILFMIMYMLNYILMFEQKVMYFNFKLKI
uniref:ATP synthase F0 subunit 8 n=1 Tax=Tetranychus truncatus TaxID=93132 RepID=A0A0U1XA01_9ACAR|nr:ATP synthase F0 subunit 8 [Tetranychus truncatus]AIM51999.1 ATP synthase F0 subunit 8 [Tetranychus truncatus]AUT13511.1 ATP synthase F0 subunit 8 [Tetranychus truncatus]AUT13524.1 ATP synthase F0 subunit 8 [Tetranychus truncatus]AUT13537.1 ATP synthase F0 subunit 8 [Tetranychus truncatus]AUT13576.1 ATP synthase F0 subunit 8 [Tetranychus truncatus]